MPITRLTLDDINASPELTARFRSPAVELLDGRVQHQPLPAAAQVECVVRIASAFDHDAYGLRVGVRESVAAPPHDLLRPELLLLHPGATRCAPAPTPAAFVALVLLAVDHVDAAQERLSRYAVAGVSEVWVVAIEDWVAAAYSAPSAGRYRRRSLLLPGEPCAPDALPWARVVVLPRTRPSAQAASAARLQPASAASSSSISKRSPATSMTSPGASRRLRRVSG